jgi:hypothetical protein
MDEKWSFVAKKQKNCDEDDPKDQCRGVMVQREMEKPGLGDKVYCTPEQAWRFAALVPIPGIPKQPDRKQR